VVAKIDDTYDVSPARQGETIRFVHARQAEKGGNRRDDPHYDYSNVILP